MITITTTTTTATIITIIVMQPTIEAIIVIQRITIEATIAKVSSDVVRIITHPC